MAIPVWAVSGGRARQGAELERELCSARSIFRAVVLLLVEERPGHGYELQVRLEEFGIDASTRGRTYRCLSWLHDAGLIEQRWEVTGTGPARRVYEVSAKGRQAVDLCATRLRTQSASLDPAMGRYIRSRLRHFRQGVKPFEFVVQARLLVFASGPDAAERKLKRTLSGRHFLDPDVELREARIPGCVEPTKGSDHGDVTAERTRP